jgi:cyclohexyl-isocyanide hydratase
MEDKETLDFLRQQAEHSRYVTSVCTGSLILAAAGLLTGYKATCHWLSLDQLAYFDVEPVNQRVVMDRNRVTGAGVTSGIDFALTLCAAIFGEERTRRAQLSMEYDPRPPFPGGSSTSSDAATIESVRGLTASFQRDREAVALRAASILREA